MTINDNYKIIFIHIPKCAGTQLQNEIFIHDIKYKIRLHSTIDLIKNIYNEQYINYFKFSIVRNPYDRFISAFFYLKNNGPFDKFNLIYKDIIMDNDIYTFANYLYANLELQNIIHFIPMYKFVCDENDNIIVDKIIHFENINIEIDEIFKKYNIDNNLTPTLISIINNIYDKL
jgi:hypothetical protein